MESIKSLWRRICVCQVNLLRFNLLLITYFSLTFSPLKKDLIDLTSERDGRYKPRFTYQRSTTNADNEETWILLLMKPSKLIKLVVKYHQGGDLIVFLVNSTATIYLWTKILFHILYTKKNEEVASYYADHYYPRLLESHPQPHRYYGIFLSLCTLSSVLRLITIYELFSRAVLNCNGYKQIYLSQLDIPMLQSLKIPMRDWFRLTKVAWKHKRICEIDVDITDEDRQTERSAHLSISGDTLKHLHAMRRLEFYYRRNIIDFSPCYNKFQFNLKNSSNSLNDWRVPKGNYRIDLWELSWFLVSLLAITIGYVVFVGLMLTWASLHELSQLTPNPNEATLLDCIYEFPNLIINIKRFIRISDIHLMSFIQIPMKSELMIAYLNLATIISRARKVDESLVECLKFCQRRCREHEIRSGKYLDIDTDRVLNLNSSESLDDDRTPTMMNSSPSETLTKIDNPSKSLDMAYYYSLICDDTREHKYSNLSEQERNLLHKNIEINLKLSRLVRNEFMTERKSFTAYLNVLFVGSGFCAAFTVALYYSGNITSLLTFAPMSIILYTLSPVVVILGVCILVERRVSIQIGLF